MSNTNRCNQGHYYPATLDKCPFCDQTQVGGGGAQSADATRKMDPMSGDSPTERVSNPPGGHSAPGVPSGGGNQDRTVIHRSGEGDKAKEDRSSAQRSLRGWLVSFTLDPSGVDYRLFEGQNTIGRNEKNQIRISNDGKVSSEHALILFRENKAFFSDKMSSNPNFVSDKELNPGESVELKDGVRIRMGSHEYIFRKVHSDTV